MALVSGTYLASERDDQRQDDLIRLNDGLPVLGKEGVIHHHSPAVT